MPLGPDLPTRPHAARSDLVSLVPSPKFSTSAPGLCTVPQSIPMQETSLPSQSEMSEASTGGEAPANCFAGAGGHGAFSCKNYLELG